LFTQISYRIQELFKKVSYLVPIGIFALSLLILDSQLHNLHLREMIKGFYVIPPQNILLAFIFTVLSYIALTGYDILALRYIDRSVLPFSRMGNISTISRV
jgi:phosphatidylglycerol lysyltransferase